MATQWKIAVATCLLLLFMKDLPCTMQACKACSMTEEFQEQLNRIKEDILQLMETTPTESACKFDFEDGIDDWVRTGTAFDNQPTYGDNPTARNRGQPANQQGDWWIGTAENRPSPGDEAGLLSGEYGDDPTGTLTSPFFKIRGSSISFLIGGGCDIDQARAELIIGDQVVKTATGQCHETMTRQTWDVGAYVGQRAQVRLLDNGSGGWHHINFDDLKGDIACPC